MSKQEQVGRRMRAPHSSKSASASCGPARLRESARIACLVFLATASTAALALACGGGVPQTIEAPELSERNRALYARTNLEKARALRAEGRHDVAESVARRGLSYEPNNTDLLRLHADLLEKLGRPEDAQALHARADELEPPLPPLDSNPHPRSVPETKVLVVLLPPAPSLLTSATRERLPVDWPNGDEATTLAQRLRVRLPHARVIAVASNDHPSARSVTDARAWLAETQPDALIGIRVDRAFCGSSVKDGDFAVAWLRVAIAHPDLPHGTAAPETGEPARSTESRLIRVALDTPADEGCEATAIAHAVERTLEVTALHEALAAAPAPEGSSWASASLRAAFPILDWRLQEEIAQGRRYLSLGELALALEHFENAERIDAEDPVTMSFLEEARRSVALARLLEPVNPESQEQTDTASPVHLGAQLSRSQRVGLEAQLAHEQRRREEMLSALAVLYEMRSAPTHGTVANMRPGEVRDPTATGIALAIARVPRGNAVEVRTLYAPDGGVLARYYFPEDSESPVLREEDTIGDGEPDRWVGYDGGVVSDVWEAEKAGGPPTLHLVYAPGGTPIERVELDHDGDGRLDRLFVYQLGLLAEESWDTDGDGAYDRFQRFDASGSLTMREEDVDGDAEIDVRTAYNNGRIVRREILNAELLADIQ
jgi:tetratricopeptide (TPR) repeat protein